MHTILYVDDEPALCRAFERALRGPGVRIITTTSAPEAVAILGRERLDVVASDYRMPELNGIEILRAARKQAPEARRLLISGRVEGEVDGDVLAEADIDGVVTKPWSLDELRRAVHRAAELAGLLREHARVVAALEEKQRKLDELQATQRGRDVRLLLATMRLRDPLEALHARRVAHVARTLAERLGSPAEEVVAIEHGALLHDVGKIGAADEQHPLVGAQLLAPLDLAPSTVATVKQHHERMDGRGFPLGLPGTELALGARIVAAADAFVKLDLLPRVLAQRDLERRAGTELDPVVVAALSDLEDAAIEAIPS